MSKPELRKTAKELGLKDYETLERELLRQLVLQNIPIGRPKNPNSKYQEKLRRRNEMLQMGIEPKRGQGPSLAQLFPEKDIKGDVTTLAYLTGLRLSKDQAERIAVILKETKVPKKRVKEMMDV